MKKMTMLLLAVFSAVFLRAQDFFPGADPQPYPPFADSWKADPMMVTGNYRMYRMDTPAPTPAPAGFKPFYLSTYGRHGAPDARPGRFQAFLPFHLRPARSPFLRPERPVRYPCPAVRCRGAERRPYG